MISLSSSSSPLAKLVAPSNGQALRTTFLTTCSKLTCYMTDPSRREFVKKVGTGLISLLSPLKGKLPEAP